MNPILMYSVAILAVALVIYMLLKKADVKITLFGVGMVLMIIAILNGVEVVEGSNNVIIDPIVSVIDAFKGQLGRAGFIILILGGYTAYMNKIGANEVTVSVLTKPLKNIKSPYVLVPIVFLLGQLLSLVIPSASNLAIILLATLYPVLKASGMSNLTAAGVIATTATVMPTPLGSDNVAIAEALNMSVSEYVFQHHARISIPAILVMAIVHFFWQKYMDKKSGLINEKGIAESNEVKEIKGGALFKTVYAILPLLPILILLGSFVVNQFTNADLKLSVEVVSVMSFIIALVCELFRRRNGKTVLEETDSFFKGMGNAMGTVALLVAATTFVNGLKAIGLINSLQTAMTTANASGIVLPLILVGLTALIVLLSGSGTALTFAMIPLYAPLAAAASISPLLLTLTVGLTGNILRAMSPVSAVVNIVAGSTKEEPIDIVKRTAVPMLAGVVTVLVLSVIFYL